MIYSHPAVYIMILPGMGVVSEIIPVFARRTIFGYGAIAFSSLAIAFVGYLVWGHHMFTSGMSDRARMVFSLLTFIVAVPSGVKVFNWVASLYKGSIRLDTPFLLVMAFIFLFSIGGLTGLVQGALSTNIHVHGTYFIVAHFHYVMFGGTVFAFLAGMHYWFPKITGRRYHEGPARLAALILFTGFNLLCRLGRHLGAYAPPREALALVPGVALNEMRRSGPGAICCAGGTWSHCDRFAKRHPGGAAARGAGERRRSAGHGVPEVPDPLSLRDATHG